MQKVNSDICKYLMNLSYSLYLLAESLYFVRNSFLYSSWYIIEFLSEWVIDDM